MYIRNIYVYTYIHTHTHTHTHKYTHTHTHTHTISGWRGRTLTVSFRASTPPTPELPLLRWEYPWMLPPPPPPPLACALPTAALCLRDYTQLDQLSVRLREGGQPLLHREDTGHFILFVHFVFVRHFILRKMFFFWLTPSTPAHWSALIVARGMPPTSTEVSLFG